MSHGPCVAARAGSELLATVAPAASAIPAPSTRSAFLARRSRDRKVIVEPAFPSEEPPGLTEGPLLVGLAVARPQLGQGAVGGARARDVQAQSGLDAGDGAVGVELPLLVGAAVTGPDLHLRARRGLVVIGVHAHLAAAAVDG